MKYRQIFSCLRLPVISVLFIAICGHAHATGTIQGRVINNTTNNVLENARVTVEGTTLEVLTNEGGYFTLPNLPAGPVKITVAYTGFKSQTRTIQIGDGQFTELEFGMNLDIEQDKDTVLLEKYTVVAERLGAEAAALNEQRMAVNLKNVVAFEEFGEMGEGNPGEFLKYVPGVNVQYAPNYAYSASLRGLPAASTLVLADGNEIASSVGERTFDLSGADSANIDRLEVSKSPTPDMPANAIGGSINIIGKSGFNSRFPVLNYNVFFTWNYLDKPAVYNPSPFEKRRSGNGQMVKQGITPAATMSWLVPFNRSVALTVNASFSDRYYPMDYCYKQWDYANQTYYNILKYTTDQISSRRLGSMALDWKPTRSSAFRASAQYSTDDSFTTQNYYNVLLGGTRQSTADTMSNSAGDGTITFTANGYNYYRTNQIYRASYRFDGSYWTIDTDVSYSTSELRRRDIDDGFLGSTSANITGLFIKAEGITKVLDGYVPKISASKTSGGPLINAFDPTYATLNTIDYFKNDNENSVLTGRLNIKRTFTTTIPLSLKIGAAYNKNLLDMTQSRNRHTHAQPRPLVGSISGIAEDYSRQNTWLYPDGTRVPAYWMSASALYDYFLDNKNNFTFDENSAYLHKTTNSKEITETIVAGYIRLDTRLFDNRMRVTAGVRYERTTDDGSGPKYDATQIYERDAYGNVIYTVSGTTRVPVEKPGLTTLEKTKLQYTERGATNNSSYGDFYPSMNLAWSVTPNILVRAAYARTISRPMMQFIIPGISPVPVNEMGEVPEYPEGYSQVVNVGNTKLKPWMAHNYDLSIESYNIKGLTISAGLFYKSITDFFERKYYVATRAVMEKFNIPEEFERALVRIYENVGDGSVSGLEWSVRWDLRYLLKWARGFSLFANGTHLRLGGDRGDDFSSFNPRIINLGAGLTRGKIIAKLSITQRDRIYTGLLPDSAVFPGGARTYTKPQTIVDFNIKYIFSKKFSIYLSARNLLSSDHQIERIAVGKDVNGVIVGAGWDSPRHAHTFVAQRVGCQLTVGVIGKF